MLHENLWQFMTYKNERFTFGEELANSISHGIGVVFGIIALLLMLSTAGAGEATPSHYVGAVLFGGGLIQLFLSSTMNHSLRSKTWGKDFFHNYDQVAIYFLIAGTYTPIALVGIHGPWGWSMFGLQWGFAIAGILVKTLLPNKYEKGVNVFTIVTYIFMGWMILYFIYPCYARIHPMGMGFIFIGGGLYTLGVVFFKLEGRLKFAHLIWHIFVLGGAVCHWLAVWLYILPLDLEW